MPVLIAGKTAADDTALTDYLEKALALRDIRIIRKKILLNQKILYDGSELILRSCSEAWNAKELYLPTVYLRLLDRLTHDLPLSEEDEKQMDLLIPLLMEKLKSQYPIYTGIVSRLQNAGDKMDALDRNGKKAFILETLTIMQMSGKFAQYAAKVPTVGISNNQGRITNKPFDPEKIILIDQSVTGFYERRTRLWDSGQS